MANMLDAYSWNAFCRKQKLSLFNRNWEDMSQLSFQSTLENASGKKIRITINDNRSTMLRVKWEPSVTKVSLHRMFLDAPRNVMQDLACYINGRDKNLTPTVKAFMEDGLRKFDYTHLLDQQKLITQGSHYNLQRIYDDLNICYFDNKLDLYITWFGKWNQRNKSQLTLGLYNESLKLIKIHQMMDSPYFPRYVVDYIVYHEMIHHVCPTYVDQDGINRVHSREFKQRELLFKEYKIAQQWLKEHQEFLFSNI